MKAHVVRSNHLMAVAAVIALATASQAAQFTFTANMDGPSESPPVPSAGTGSAIVDFDTDLHTMRVRATWSGLTGTTTVAHIHAPTAVAFAGTVGVATYPGTFPGWPTGVSSGSYDMTFDMSLASSYTGTFLSTHGGGTPAGAEAALINFIQQGRAYFNIHSSFATGGEIRGFLVPTPGAAAIFGVAALGAMRRRR